MNNTTLNVVEKFFFQFKLQRKKINTFIWFSKHVNNFNHQENAKLKATSFTQTATTLKNK